MTEAHNGQTNPCPMCNLREVSPQAFAHLTTALAEFAAAMGLVLEALSGGVARQPRAGVQKISIA